MANLIEKTINVKTSVIPAPIVKTEEIKPETPVIQREEKNTAKKILPLGLIAGGGLLIYYGVKKPGVSTFLKKLVKERIEAMEESVKVFTKDAKEIITNGFKNSEKPVAEYQKLRWFDSSGVLDSIRGAEDSKSLMKAECSAFDVVKKEVLKDSKNGAPDFENYKSYLYGLRRRAFGNVDPKRSRNNRIFWDYTYIPPFKNGKHADLIEASSNQITEKTKFFCHRMWEIQNEHANEFIRPNLKQMAESIQKGRDLILEAKHSLIDAAFAKARELLKLSEDFTPSYGKVPVTDNFIKLKPSQLKPQQLPDNLDKLFGRSIFGDFIKTTDFSKNNTKALKTLFLRMSQFENIDDLAVLIDRLRLGAEVDKFCGKNNQDLYKTLTAKLEFLSVKLREIGEKEVLKKCDVNFETLNPEQKRAKLYYIHDLARRIGLNTFEKMDKYMAERSQKYSQMSVRKMAEEIKNNPEMYFF